MQNQALLNQVEDTPATIYREILRFNPQSVPGAPLPRERLMEKGPRALSDQELLAIILNCGTKGKHVSILAGELLERLERVRELPTVRDLQNLGGLGQAKACLVIAMLELGRRYWDVTGVKIRTPLDIFRVVRHYANRKQERFIVISLNGAHELIAVRVVTVGLVNRTIVHPREVFADPLMDRCSAICVCHNHPSGELEPSREDDEVTKSLESAAGILGIRFLDHLIFSDRLFYSYRQENRLKAPEHIEVSRGS